MVLRRAGDPNEIKGLVIDLEYGEYIVAYQADASGAYNMSATLTQTDYKGNTYTGEIFASPFLLKVVPRTPKVRFASVSPTCGPETGDTTVSFEMLFERPDPQWSGGGKLSEYRPGSRGDFVAWLDYLESRDMSVQFSGWDGLDTLGDEVRAKDRLWETKGWYDDATGFVRVKSPEFKTYITAGTMPVCGLASFSTVELKAQNMDYTQQRLPFFYYSVPVTVSYFDPAWGPDFGRTGVRVSGSNFVSNQQLPPYREAKCKFGEQINKQATFLTGTGFLLCIPLDYRTMLECGPAFGNKECPKVSSVPLTISLNGQQFTEPSSYGNFSFYKSPVSVSTFTPFSGPLQGGTQLVVGGVNLLDTGQITCRFGDPSAISSARPALLRSWVVVKLPPRLECDILRAEPPQRALTPAHPTAGPTATSSLLAPRLC